MNKIKNLNLPVANQLKYSSKALCKVSEAFKNPTRFLSRSALLTSSILAIFVYSTSAYAAEQTATQEPIQNTAVEEAVQNQANNNSDQEKLQNAQTQSILTDSAALENLGIAPKNAQAIAAHFAKYGQNSVFHQPQAGEWIDDVLNSASENGLPAERYAYENAEFSMLIPDEQLAQKAAMILQFAEDMERGIIAPKDISPAFDFTPKAQEPEILIEQFQNAPESFAHDIEPNDPAYPLLKAELADLRKAQEAERLANVPLIDEGETMRLGDYGERVGQLRARLAYLGFEAETTQDETTQDESAVNSASADKPAASADNQTQQATTITTQTPIADPLAFDEGLEKAVKAYQLSQAIEVDGIVGPASIALLNLGVEDKIEKVLVGLERHRWGPMARDGRRIYVNLANFMAEVRDDNVKTFETVVVVGQNKEDFRTPEFQDVMTHMIVNPKWNVPESISVKEYLPQIQRDPSVLSRQNITMRIKGSNQVVDPALIDMSQFTVEDFPFLLQQQEGDANALGRVKFMFPNRHNIYLHDTPAKSLFARSIRAYSHGCVRVEDPEGLAKTLLEPQFEDPIGTYNAMLAKSGEQYVNLTTPIPIYITYFTAYPDAMNKIAYMPDTYGRDKILRHALEEEGVVF